MKKYLYFLFFIFLFQFAHATHNRAGEITYRLIGGTTYEITVTTYTRIGSPADRCELTVYFGDGDTAVFNRSNGTTYVKCGSQIPDGEDIALDIRKNIYKGTHTYPGTGGTWTYLISVTDPNRIADIQNIINSVNVPFSIQTELIISSILGENSSPVLLNPPIDNACTNVCFYHNPGAYDPNGDSLSYKLVSCLSAPATPISNYTLPPTTGTLFIDPVTGDFEWCSPPNVGIYNIAILIEEWRTINGQRFKIGSVLRDMEIDVSSCNNQPPLINDLKDTCVLAGTNLSFNVSASDPNNNAITLSASGGPLSSVAPPLAIFNAVFGPSPVSSSFQWLTDCEHVRKQPYLISFKAKDSGTPSLVDFESVKITVVAPAPENVTITAIGTSFAIKWSPSICNPTNNKFIGYKIYRKSNPSGWSPGYCETGVPAYTGFIQVGQLSINQGFSILDTSFLDNNNGTGLIHGTTYCYRVVACFVDGAESYASEEICGELKKDVPIITNVDVISTDLVAGEILVKWLKPVAGPNDFDTILHPGPYRFDLHQSFGFTMSNPILINTYNAPTFSSLATVGQQLVTGLNTQDSAYTYRVDFYAQNGADFISSSHIASSVFLTIIPSDDQLQLSWKENVPWTNYIYYIYKEASAGNYILYDSTSLQQYIDLGLINGETYCYYIESKGAYSDTTIPRPLLNKSQRICGIPIDLTPPCNPKLMIVSDCVTGINQLIWNNPNNDCSDDVVAYNIYYTPVQDEPLSLLNTINSALDTTYFFSNPNSVAGCYVVTAIDSANNESLKNNVFCVDNCPVYELPNVFSPDGDGINDLYTPIYPYRQIKNIEIKIYDRWGLLMFETSNPDIKWDGINQTTKVKCSDGVYYYTCIVNEIRVFGIRPRELKGFIHLIQGKGKQG